MSTTPANLPVSCETLEAECNVLGMELLNVLEFIGETIDYRKITLLVQKLSNSMDLITNGVIKLKNIGTVTSVLEVQLLERKGELIKLQEKLKKYNEFEINS